MTRVTKMSRKRHLEASAFEAKPLQPTSTPAVTQSPSITPKNNANNNNNKKRTRDEPVAQNPKTENDLKTDSTSTQKKAKLSSRQRKALKAKKGGVDGETQVVDSRMHPDRVRGERRMNSDRVSDSKHFSELRRQRRQNSKVESTICFSCRQTGHSVRNCPSANEQGVGMCYHCGTLEHTSKDCKNIAKKKTPFKFAVCFVCKASGHLASACPENDNGLYPNGGCCRFCKGVDHLARDCKFTTQEIGTTTIGVMSLAQGADDDDFHIFSAEKMQAGREEKEIKDAMTAARREHRMATMKGESASSAMAAVLSSVSEQSAAAPAAKKLKASTKVVKF